MHIQALSKKECSMFMKNHPSKRYSIVGMFLIIPNYANVFSGTILYKLFKCEYII